jgi:hypothetical protein
VLNPSSSPEFTQNESKGMATNTTVSAKKSSSRNNTNGDDESEESSTDDCAENCMPDASLSPNALPQEVFVDSNCWHKNTGTVKGIHAGHKILLDDHRDDACGKAKSSKISSPPVKMSVNDSTTELTASETSADTKFQRSPTTIFDCDIDYEDPPLPNEIPRYIFTRTLKKSSEVGSTTRKQMEEPPSKHPTLKRLLHRFHRPSQIKEILCDSDSEIFCSTLISL